VSDDLIELGSSCRSQVAPGRTAASLVSPGSVLHLLLIESVETIEAVSFAQVRERAHGAAQSTEPRLSFLARRDQLSR
jgi:hypothetical protein